jgi:metal-responsive CopG/Arc/MetJ family transcriptional regulator
MTKVVSIKMNPALLLRIDGLTSNRSDFIRAAVEEKVKRAGAKGKSTWDALAKTVGLDITIPKAAGQVGRTDL